MILPKRKATRLPGFDYASHNFYFITICTYQKRCIFGKPNQVNSFGFIAKECLCDLSKVYPQVTVDCYVVMPNHIHAIMIIGSEGKMDDGLPSLTKVVGQYKMTVTKRIHEQEPDMKIWQRSFHDHIIRDRKGYEKIYNYIVTNPMKWEEDCFYCGRDIE